ncbi:hypothetical protein [Micromonospora sp. DT229]|uniref:hypothetical protein n=1 Tax=Micromonospora sp. DT229 TaxID=3393430 RepID=UPI003CF3C6DF
MTYPYSDPDHVTELAKVLLSDNEAARFDYLSEAQKQWIGSQDGLIRAVREYESTEASVQEVYNRIRDIDYRISLDLYRGPYREYLASGQVRENPGHMHGSDLNNNVSYHHLTREGEQNMTATERQELTADIARGGAVAYDREIDNAASLHNNAIGQVRGEFLRLINEVQRSNVASIMSVVGTNAQGRGPNTNQHSGGSSNLWSYGSGSAPRRR